MRKDRGYYWVYAEVSCVYKDGKLVEYKSMRSFVPKETRVKMQKIYDDMRLEDKENVRFVSYVPYELYYELVTKESQKKLNFENLLQILIKK